MRCGLLGRVLGHSYSPMIHGMLGQYSYDLFPTEPEALDALLRGDAWDGLNVTIPYKKTVVPYCAELSETAEKLGSVNTLVRRADGTIYGANTDYDGFRYLVRQSGFPVAGRKALVLGSGGASVTVCAVLRDLGAASVTVISRSGPDNYENLERHADAQIIANTTPLGMYPNTGSAAVDLRAFPRCEGVFDIVYNPARTALLLQAEQLGIPCAGGLSMLVAQAKRSAELFTGTEIADGRVAEIERAVRARLENIVIIGCRAAARAAWRGGSASGWAARWSSVTPISSSRPGRRSRRSSPRAARRRSAASRPRRCGSWASGLASFSRPAAAASRGAKIIRCCTRTERSSGCCAVRGSCRATAVRSRRRRAPRRCMPGGNRCTGGLST